MLSTNFRLRRSFAVAHPQARHCHAPACYRTFKNSSGLTQHINRCHPGLKAEPSLSYAAALSGHAGPIFSSGLEELSDAGGDQEYESEQGNDYYDSNSNPDNVLGQSSGCRRPTVEEVEDEDSPMYTPTHTPMHTPMHTPTHTPTHTPMHTPTHTPIYASSEPSRENTRKVYHSKLDGTPWSYLLNLLLIMLKQLWNAMNMATFCHKILLLLPVKILNRLTGAPMALKRDSKSLSFYTRKPECLQEI